MSFTDDDLKRLKVEGLRMGNISSEDFKALLARLEAAEQCAKWLRAHQGTDTSPLEDQAIEAWRKAAGK